MSGPNPFARTPRLIAIAGDWHGNAAAARRAIAWANKWGCEGILQLGDFGIWPGQAGQMFLDDVAEDLADAGVWCAFIDGNHEDFWQLNAMPLDENGLRPVRERLWHIPRGTRWEWGGRQWLGIGGATSLDRWQRQLGTSWWPEEALTHEDCRQVMAGGRADVVLSHDCPSDVPIPGLHSNWPPDLLAEATRHREVMQSLAEVVQATAWWHGHFHVRYQARVEFAGVPCSVNGLADDSAPPGDNVVIVDIR